MAYYSGLVVTCAPGAMDAVLAALKSSKTAEVHQTDPATGRIVVVIEDDSVHGEADKFQRLRTMVGVADVSLIVHRSDEETPRMRSPSPRSSKNSINAGAVCPNMRPLSHLPLRRSLCRRILRLYPAETL